ncbi:hypothetical protein IWZ01DRAFT_324443 [Phyllosticta capitalensis]
MLLAGQLLCAWLYQKPTYCLGWIGLLRIELILLDKISSVQAQSIKGCILASNKPSLLNSTRGLLASSFWQVLSVVNAAIQRYHFERSAASHPSPALPRRSGWLAWLDGAWPAITTLAPLCNVRGWRALSGRLQDKLDLTSTPNTATRKLIQRRVAPSTFARYPQTRFGG